MPRENKHVDADFVAQVYRARGQRDPGPVKKIFYMLDKQQEEITPSMLLFYDDDYIIRILSDSYGFLTARVHLRPTNVFLCTVQFQKVVRRGAVWTFKNVNRLWFLGVEPEKIIEKSPDFDRLFVNAKS